MTAAELRKKLDEGLKVDNSGKSTPMQRLTPFLHDLVTYLEEHEAPKLVRFVDPETGETADLPEQKVSSDDATRAATAQTNSESDGAPKEPA